MSENNRMTALYYKAIFDSVKHFNRDDPNDLITAIESYAEYRAREATQAHPEQPSGPPREAPADMFMPSDRSL